MSSVIIFGGSRGIGRMLTDHFVDIGWNVTSAARTGKAVANVTDESSVRRIFEEHAALHGEQPHAVVSTAAVQGPIGSSWTVDSLAWRDTLTTNLFGAFVVTKCAVEAMLARGSGAIVHLSGGGAAFGRPNFSAYAASKAGLLRFVETVAGELRDAGHPGILVNAIAPGGVSTDMTAEILRHADRAGAKEIAEAERVRRSGGTPPRMIAALVDFLCDPRTNPAVSGRLFHVKDDYVGFAAAGDVPDDTGKLRRVPLS